MSAADVAADLAALGEADALLASPVPVGAGPLAPLIAGAVRGLAANDWWVPGLRERAGAVLRGVSAASIGDGSQGSRPYRVAPVSPSPAVRALHAVGLAMAEPDRAVLVHLGTGSVADGAFAEALNLAALRRARVIFLIAAIDLDSAPVPRQSAASLEGLAAAHGVRFARVDGGDAEAVRKCVASARDQDGPTLIAAEIKN